MTTQKKGTWAYRRVLQVYSLPKRVIQDVEKVFLALKTVRDAKGIKIDGVGNSRLPENATSSLLLPVVATVPGNSFMMTMARKSFTMMSRLGIQSSWKTL
jgi:hypothetical protein